MIGIKAFLQIAIARFRVSLTFAISIDHSNDTIKLEEKIS
jgi:hypothetical protein